MTVTANQVPASRLPGLDALRGIAALCVLQFHALCLLPGDQPYPGKGYLAVDFFFMLSGYVMARTYEHRLAEGYGAIRFMIARYRRLWPMMAVGLLIGVPIAALKAEDLEAFAFIAIANFLLIPVFTGVYLFPINAAAWSIFAELAANLLHSLWLWRARTVLIATMSLCLLPALAWLAFMHGVLDLGAEASTVWIGLLRALFAYGLGIVLWRSWRDCPPLQISPFVACVAMPVTFFSVALLQLDSWTVDVAFIALICPLMLAGCLSYQGEHRLIAWVGGISFPLYAIHLPILHWSIDLGFGAAPGIMLALALATYLAMRVTSGRRKQRSPAMEPAVAAIKG